MEKYFKPVHSPQTSDEIKARRHHHHHHLHHHQDHHSQSYAQFEDTDRNTDESHGHHRHHHHGHSLHYGSNRNTHHRHHQAQHFHHSEEDEILYSHDTPVTLSKASSSSLSSSSSSSSSSSWYTEASANDPFSLRHAERPQHSLSCSNIPDIRKSYREDDSSEPIVFAAIKHGSNGNICNQFHGSSQQRGGHALSSLDRGHSRSEEGLIQSIEGHDEEQDKYGPLYKTTSLNRSLAFSEEDILLGVSRGPKRAVSSSQLPSKGILKNKDPHSDIRKAKSMEVLSPRVAKGQHPGGAKDKGISQADIEHARAKFLEGKLQFSAFLDEITKQVISPSYLTVLGVNTDKASSKACAPAQTPGPVKPQLPPKKHRGSSGEEREKHIKQQSRQEKSARNSSAQKHSDCSKSEKIISYAARSHHGSPPPHHYPNSASHSIHHGRGRKDKRPSPLGSSGAVDKFGRCGPQLTDGTSTSPEPIQPKQRHHRKQQTTALHNPHPNTQHFHHSQSQQGLHGLQRGPNPSPPSSLQGAGVGLRSESSSSKSDSSRTRDTASTATSHSSGQSGHHNSQHAGSARQHRETPCDVEHLQALQEENADLHQNLLQTVVCIESLEAELQRTRDELINVKEKYKSLLETHSGTKQANNLLGEHLHIASESLTSERKYLLNRVSQLSSELEDAHRTIGALENINVPCLIKDLLEKHFDSPEAVQKFLTTSAFASRSAAPPQAGHQPHEGAEDWMMKSEAGLQRATAFSPFNQEAPRGRTEVSCQNETSPPFSVDDISNAIYEKIAANYAARSQSVFPHGHDRSARGTNCTDTPPNVQQALVGGDSLCEKGEVQVTLLEEDIVDVTSMSAQQILDDFMHQLQAHKEVGGGKEQQGRQEWVGGVEQTGKVAD